MTEFMSASQAEAIRAESVTDPAPTTESAPSFVCPECGDSFTRPLNLGSHRRSKHGVVGAGGHSKRKDSRARAREAKPRPVVEAIKQFGVDAGAGRSTAAPAEKELTKAFGRAIGTVSIAGAYYVVEGDPRLRSDEEKEQMAEYLSLSPQGAGDVAEPIARAFHRSPLNKRYGRAVVDNVDLVASVSELVILSMHWRRYQSGLHAWERAVQSGGALPMSPYTAPDGGTLGPSAAAQNGQPAGKVWTAEDVERARATEPM